MKKFKKIYIEITNICNLSCHFCPGTKRANGFISKALFEKILEEIHGHTSQVYFHVMGEPLLHPELGLFLELCANSSIKVNITTNGTLIKSQEEVLLAADSLRQMNFSLHSCEANISKMQLDHYLDDIFSFIKRSIEGRNLLIGLRLWNISNGEPQDINKHILNRIKAEFKLKEDINHEVTPAKGFKIFDNIFLHIAEVFDWPDINSGFISQKGFCYGLRDQAAILLDGTVVPCCLDKDGIISFGNIMNQSFKDIISNERARKFYEGFSRREVSEELCKKCGYRKRFD